MGQSEMASLRALQKDNGQPRRIARQSSAYGVGSRKRIGGQIGSLLADLSKDWMQQRQLGTLMLSGSGHIIKAHPYHGNLSI